MFLALAAGIVIGTTALNGPVVDGLRGKNAGLVGDRAALQGTVSGLQSELDTSDRLLTAALPQLVGGSLTGQKVALLTAPGSDAATADALVAAVQKAGGAVTSRVALQPKLVDPASTQLVEDLVASVVPAGTTLPTGSTPARAGSVLGSALLTRAGGKAVDADAARSVLSAFQEAGLLTVVSGAGRVDASLALLVAAPPAGAAQDDADGKAVDALLTLAGGLRDRSSGLVVAGVPATATGNGLIRALRRDAARSHSVSSVDDADRAAGQVAVVLALKEQLGGGAGQYGGAPGSTAPAPAQPATAAVKPTGTAG